MAEHEIYNAQPCQHRRLPQLEKEIIHLVEQSWQYKLLSRLTRGPVHVDELGDALTLEDLVEGHLLRETHMVGEQQTRLITDLERKGFLKRDGDTLTGLGEYSQIPITETEHQVLSEMGWFRRTQRGE